MSIYIKNGSSYRMTTKENLVVQDTLPVGNYVVQYDSNSNTYYLDTIDNFTIPNRLYGDTLKNTDRILRTFLDRPSSTGVLLNGEKGSGKTLLAKNISVVAAKQYNIPTILVNAPWHGDTFNTFIQRIEQPVILFFDEFEKVYSDKESKESVLTLFDGVFSSKKLFICTCNDRYKLDDNMINRPGRLYYSLDFDGLDVSFIKQYCEENLHDKTKIDSILRVSILYGKMNFDMIKSIVEEINRYGEDIREVIKIVNAKPENSVANQYDYTWIPSEEWMTELGLNANTPNLTELMKKKLTGEVSCNVIRGQVSVDADTVDGQDWISSYWEPQHITKVETNGTVYYQNEFGTLILNRSKPKRGYPFAF